MRDISDKELDIIRFLSAHSNGKVNFNITRDVKVRDLSDGGMGSVAILYEGDVRSDEQEVATALFKDDDGVDVSISLFADAQGRPTCLDIWKVNFEPLLRYPDSSDLTV